jgi:16S rRNA (cytosine1402-N4)-methyltransferase
MSEEYLKHYSVLFKECMDFARNAGSDIESPKFADMTFGGGGHSLAFADLYDDAIVYCTDQDPEAIANGRKIITNTGKEQRVNLLKMNYEQFPEWMSTNKPEIKFNSILMDLGVSSHHFDKFDRGFSFREDAALDMRMDFENEKLYTVAEVLNTFDEEDIANIIFKYGEERLSRRIAKAIIEFRETKQFETTKELENIVFHAYPSKQRHGRIHPATKTFQALRIFVNRELEVLENTLEALFNLLAPGGVLQVISFHSLEDRIAKHKFKELFQCNKNTAKILTKKPIYPGEEELSENSRSRSAKLRVLQKLS